MEQLKESARQRALDSLGISSLQQRLDRTQQQQSSLESKEQKTKREMLAKIRAVPLRQLSESGYYNIDAEVSEAVEKRQSIHEDELLAETPRGRNILTLRVEKENLLDTVWLATSSKQIKELWQKVDEMLGGQQSPLQREALAIEPVESDE